MRSRSASVVARALEEQHRELDAARDARRGSSPGCFGGWSGKPRNTSAAHARAAAARAWASEVIRPPSDLPPATSGRSGRESRAAVATAARTVAWSTAGRVGPPAAGLGVGELVAQRGDPRAASASAIGLHEPVPHAGAGAVGQHVEHPGVRRAEQDAGHACRCRSPTSMSRSPWLAPSPSRPTPAPPCSLPSAARQVGHQLEHLRQRIRLELLHPLRHRLDACAAGCRACGSPPARSSGTDTGAPGSGRTLNGATSSLPDPFWR